MKLWQKIYLITMVLFVVLLNIGMYVVFELTYQKDIKVEQKQAEAEFNMLTASMNRSLNSLYNQGDVTDAKLRKVIEKYEHYYEDTLSLIMWRSEECVYPKDAELLRDWKDMPAVNEIRLTGKDEKTLIVQGRLYEGEEILYLRYEKKLTGLMEVWDTLRMNYLLISTSFSVLLAITLFIVLRKTMKPITQLTRVVDDMAEGNWESKASEKGRDEVATLGRHFNRMADKLQENIQQMKQEADAKQEFVDNFSHELKSPLTSIYGFAEYVQKANVSEEEKIKCMSYIMDESNRLLQLSYTLLDMAKIRNEEVHTQEVLLGDMQEQIEKRMETLCTQKGVTLTCERGVDTMHANEVLLYSLLCNLIQNAVYACEQGDIVKWGVNKEGEYLRVFVEDTGCGMSPEEVMRVREPFYRVDKARSREAGRTGLGLALCSQIAEYHNARMDIQSEKNKGTVISVLFPQRFTV